MDSETHGTILIVDDDPGAALLHRKCLERRGFSVLSAATSLEAMRAVQNEDVQLIVLDYRLSDGTTGIDFCEMLKACDCSVPVVIVTGFSREATAVEALRAGVRDFVTKSPEYLNYLPIAVERVLRQVHIERQLSRTESRFAAIIKSSQDAIIAIDDQQTITLFNPAAEEIFRCPPGEAVGTSVKRFLPDEASSASGTPAFQSGSMLVANARAPRWRVAGARADGTTVPLELAVSHWVELGKSFSTFVIRDITRQKQAEESLQASENRFRAFMDNGPAVAFIKDTEGRYVYVNRRFTEMLKMTAAQVEGKTAAELLPPAVASQIWANDRIAAVATTVIRLMETIPTPEGEDRIWMTFRFSFENSCGETLIGGVGIDVTDQTRSEEVLRLRNEQLRKTQRMEAVGTLAGGIAHEFNNLLQVIQGHATFATQGLSADEPRFQDLQHVLVAVQHANLLTKQILGFGKRQLLQIADIDPNRVVRDVIKMIRPLMGAHLHFEIALDDEIGLVLADADQLRQVLMNLCLNARDAMPLGGNLFVATGRRKIDAATQFLHPELSPGRYVVLTVRDTGIGIADNIKEHIFEPFFTTKGVGKGTGLGLALVYGIVQQHGGAIDVKSDFGRGTTFEVYLPCHPDCNEWELPHDAATRTSNRLSPTPPVAVKPDAFESAEALPPQVDRPQCIPSSFVERHSPSAVSDIQECLS